MAAQDEERLQLRLRREYAAPGLLEIQDTIVKAGPQAWKTAALLTFGDKGTGAVKRRMFVVQTWERDPTGEFGFERKADFRWSCDNHEIGRLVALLTTELPTSGTYTLIQDETVAAKIAALVGDDADQAALAVAQLLSIPEVCLALAES